HRRDKLIGLFWAEQDQEHARAALRKAVYRLRQSLGEDVVVSQGDDAVGLAEDAVWCDAVAFEEALEAGKLEDALELYRGDLLDGFYISEAPEFERWLEGERERLRQRAAEAAWALAEREAEKGNAVEAAHWARRAAALAADDEGAIRRGIEFLDGIGDRAGALKEYEAFARRLREEYEAEPSPETQALIAAVRERDVAATGGSPEWSAEGREREARGAEVSPTDAPRRWLTWRNAVVSFVIALAVWGLVATGLFLLRRLPVERAGETAGEVMRVAVFPFSVPSDAEYADLSEGLMELLGAALDGAGEVREADPYGVLSRLRRSEARSEVDIETARRITRELGASHFVFGRLLDLSGTIRISTSLYSLADDSTWQSDHAGQIEELPGLVHTVARDILVHLEPVQGEFRGSVSGGSTSSYTALRAYLRGQAYMRRHHTDSALVEYRTAVQEDSMFALAWMRLAEAAEYRSADFASVTNWQRALNLRGRLSPRNRASLEMGYAFGRGDGLAAERVARAMVATYPDAVEGWRYLGDILRIYPWQLGRNTAPEAEAAYLRALALDPDNELAVNGLALVAYYDGRKARGDSFTEQWTGAQWVPPEDSLGRAQYFTGLETRTFRRLVNRVWLICYATDSLADAGRITALLTDPARPVSERAIGHHLGAWVGVARGQWQAADEHFGRANRLEPGMGVLERAWYSTFPFFEFDSTTLRAIHDSLVPWTAPAAYGQRERGYAREWRLPRWLLPHAKHYVLGLLSARLGDAEAAAGYAARLERAVEPTDSIALLQDLALEVRALAAAEWGEWEEALARLAEAELKADPWAGMKDSPFSERPLGRFLRAEALLRLGREQEALSWYSTLGWVARESVWVAQVQLRQGEIYERLGDAAEAVRHYRRFVARWREADPEYQPLVYDVKARIARLATDQPVE
ncbi:MAG: BTAD domain-containing putative transcriptional regulator, partial [Gemmatimonadales bacterium]